MNETGSITIPLMQLQLQLPFTIYGVTDSPVVSGTLARLRLYIVRTAR